MSSARVRRGALAAAWLMPLLACSAAAPATRAPAPPAERAASGGGIERFLPLRDGFVLSYWVWLPEQQEPEQVIFQVERRSRSRANLRSGKTSKWLVLSDSSVRLVTGGALLEAPLTLGNEWSGALGRVRISAVDRSIEVSAGSFSGCIETTELAQDPGDRAIITTYCPDVGITEIRVEAEDGEQRFELKSFGPRVDINAM